MNEFLANQFEYLKVIKVGLQFPPTDLHQIALPWSDPKSGCECQVTVVERREIENRRETKNHTGEGGEQEDALFLSYNSFAIDRSVLSGYYKLLVS